MRASRSVAAAAAQAASEGASKAAPTTTAATATATAAATTTTTTSNGDAVEVYTPATLLTVSPEHRQQLRTAFDLFDRDGVGRIPAHDVKVALYALGYDVSDAQLRQLLRDVGVTSAAAAAAAAAGSGAGDAATSVTIDFTDFYNVLVRQMTRKESRLEAVRAFRLMDRDMKGYIAMDDIREMADALHADLSDEELLEMLQFAHNAGAATTAAASGGGGGGGAGGVTAAVSDGDAAKEPPVVSEDDFLRLMKLANVY